MIAPAFHESALCAEVDGDLWFPEKGGSTRLAKLICNGDDARPPCPAREECLQWALDHGEAGIWGGTSELERRRLKRPARRNGPRKARDRRVQCPQCDVVVVASSLARHRRTHVKEMAS